MTKKGKIREKTTNKINLRRFALTYILLMGAFFFIIGFTPLQRVIDLNGAYTRAVVHLTSKVLSLMNIHSTVHGSIITITHNPAALTHDPSSISLDVRFGCNGLEAVMIYAVAVVAFPAPWRRRLFGIILGFIAIQVINILRIAGLAYSGIHFKEVFEYIHIYVAQGMMIAVSLGIFFIYLSRGQRTDDRGQRA